MLSSTATVQAMAHSLPSRAVEAPVVGLAHYNKRLMSSRNFQKRRYAVLFCFFNKNLYKPNANPAICQNGKSAVGRTLLSAIISLNF